ncbi:MAG: FecR domain-containing protein [Pseudorhodoplanes sp.]|nr:FecR domain-containing protein [Pseudorhodoplanes sp.]
MKHGSLISPDEPSFSFGRATAGFDLRQADAPGDFVTIPDADLLFNGAFKRVGDDLSITGRDGAHFVVEDYFRTNKRATLLSPEGAALTPAVVEALAGPLAPGQYAQAGSAPSANPPIGRVDKVEGNASVVRNGVTIVLNTGDVVLKGDVVQTGAGASLGIVFSDGTAFSLAANARMVLNDFVYSAGASNNSALISLVQGSISFVAGQVAKTGDMRVDTPVATMGIRGTAVLVEINANNGQTKFSVMVEPNGTVGSFNLYDKGTGALLATVNNSTIGWVVTPVGPLQVLAQQVQKTPAELAQELVVIQQVFQIFDQGQQNPFDPSQPPQQQPPTDPSNRGDNTDPQNTQTAQGTQFIPSNDGVITVTVTQPAAGGGSGNSQSSNSSSSSSSGSTGTGTGTTSDTTTTDTDSASSVTYIFGTDGNDVLTGTANDDLLYAFGGDDIIIAGHGGGDDYYEGGSGFDEIRFTSTTLGVLCGGYVKGGLRHDRRRRRQRHRRL